PTPRRFGTTTSMVLSGASRRTPPLCTSLKYRLPSGAARGPSTSPYPNASVSTAIASSLNSVVAAGRSRRAHDGQRCEDRGRLGPHGRQRTVLRVVDRPPHPLGCARHVDVADAQMADRINDSVLRGGRRADRARLADALRTERVEIR